MMVKDPEYWYAIQTYFAQEIKVGQYLDACKLSYFIPMCNSYRVDAAGEEKLCTHPVVHNLIFLRKTKEQKELQRLLDDCPYAVKVYAHVDNASKWYEIPDRDILDLRIICDQTFVEPEIITQQECDLQVGRMVVVKHGPLRGVRGKLVRKKKKYYVVKSFVGMGVMVSVSRWCCAPDE